MGAVIAAHGVTGEVKVKTFTANPEALTAYGPLATNGGRVLNVIALKPGKGDEAIVHFEGISDRNAAERLKGEQLSVARAALPQTAADEFYHADLVGLRVEDASGQQLGKLVAVYNFGAGDIIEVEGPKGVSELVPFNTQTILKIDVARGCIVIEPPRYEDQQ